MAILRSVHEFSIDPAYFALKKRKKGGGDYDELEERVEHLEDCCEQVQPKIEEMDTKIIYMYEVVETLDHMIPITNPEIDTIFN